MKRFDPVRLSIYQHLLAACAEEMGAALGRSASSANIKERRDYSCAVFDGAGRMIAQAAHIPVHLGSMPLSVAAALRRGPLERGDAVLVNDPYEGGRTCPTSRWSRRCSCPASDVPVSTSRTARTTPMSAA
jgi:N-methylhydantoinase B